LTGPAALPDALAQVEAKVVQTTELSEGGRTFFGLPIQVNAVSLAMATVPFSHPDAPKLTLLAKVSAMFPGNTAENNTVC
jgi:hypothetical protein